MADTQRLKRSRSNIYIEDVPASWTSEEKTQFADMLDRVKDPSQLVSSYAEALSLINQGTQRPTGAPVEGGTTPSQPVPTTAPVQQGMQPGIAMAPEPIEETTDLLDFASGVAGGVVREKGPTAALTAAGAGIGSVVPGMGTALGAGAGYVTGEVVLPLVDALASLSNAKLGTNFGTSQEMFSNFFDRLGIDQPESAAENLTTGLASGALDAAATVNLGRILENFGPELGEDFTKTVGRILQEAPAQEYAGSIGGQVGARGTQELLQSEAAPEWTQGEVAQTALPMVGGLVGGGLAAGAATPIARRQAAAGTPMTTAQREAIEAGQRYGVEPTTSDILADTSARAAQRQRRGAEARGGTAQQSYDINTARSQVVDNLGRQYNVEISGLGGANTHAREIAENFLTNRKEDVYRNANLKRDVIERLSGEPVDEFVVEIDPEMGTTLVVRREGGAPGPQPDLVATRVEGTNVVDTSDTLKLIDDARAQMIEDGLTSDNKVINLITDWENALQDKNLAAIERIRRKISNEWTDPNRSIGRDEKELYRRIYSSLNEDMGKFIQDTGTQSDYNQWRVANRNLSELMRDFDVPAMASALRQGDASPNMVTDLLKSNEPERIRDIFSGLDEEGKRLAKTNIVGAMIQNSIDGNRLSGNTFSNQIKSFQKSLDVVMSPQEIKQLEGMKAWLDSTAFHEEVVTGRPRGDQGIQPSRMGAGFGPVTAGAARANPALALGASSAGTFLRGAWYRHYESPQVRDLMVRIANTKPGTTMREELSKRLLEAVRGAEDAERGREAQVQYGRRGTPETAEGYQGGR